MFERCRQLLTDWYPKSPSVKNIKFAVAPLVLTPFCPFPSAMCHRVITSGSPRYLRRWHYLPRSDPAPFNVVIFPVVHRGLFFRPWFWALLWSLIYTAESTHFDIIILEGSIFQTLGPKKIDPVDHRVWYGLSHVPTLAPRHDTSRSVWVRVPTRSPSGY